MSSNPFADLARCTLRFAEALDEARSRDDGAFTATSPAGIATRVERYADEWGDRPLRDAYISAAWYSIATTDHLRALAALIETPLVLFSLWTAARGAMEAAAQGAYLADPDAADLERVRRHMNDRLKSAHEVLSLKRLVTAEMNDPDADREQTATARIFRSAPRHELRPLAAKGQRAPCLDAESPSMTNLVELAIEYPPDLGRMFYKSMSAVAHARSHGLMPLTSILEAADDAAFGDYTGQFGASAAKVALQLAGAPLAAVAMTNRLAPMMGWDIDSLARPSVEMREVWHRVGQLVY